MTNFILLDYKVFLKYTDNVQYNLACCEDKKGM